MPDYSTRTSGRRRRYDGGRMRGRGGIGLMPLILIAVCGLFAWKFHAGALPGLAQVRGFLGL